MARLWSSGFELNSLGSSVEITTTPGTGGAIVTSPVRSGTYAFQAATTGLGKLNYYTFSSSAAQGVFYFRTYINISTMPSADASIFYFTDQSDGTGGKVGIKLTTTGALQLYNIEDSAQVGSNSATLSTGTQYCVEFGIDTTTLAATLVEARLNEVSFASGSVNITAGCRVLLFGVGTGTATVTFDDIAINNNSGSSQNGWPGAEKIVHQKPSAAGDQGDWTGDNTDIDEVTPDDTTTKLSSNTLNQIEDVGIEVTPSSIGARDIINVVAVGVRFNGVGASANASFVLRIKASPGGTVEESAAITPTNATWVTNAIAAPRNHSLVLYDLPGSSSEKWTKFDVDPSQIGVRLSTASTNAAQISTLWLLVGSTPTSLVLNNYQSVSASSSNAGIISVTERVW